MTHEVLEKSNLAVFAIENISSTRRQIVLNVNPNDLNINRYLNKYMKTSKIKGFRPGKAPMDMVKKIYANEAFEDAFDNYINTNVRMIIEDAKWNIVSSPQLANTVPADGGIIKCTIVVDVIPDIVIGDISNILLKKPVHDEITDEDIDAHLEYFLRKFANYNTDDINDDAVVEYYDLVSVGLKCENEDDHIYFDKYYMLSVGLLSEIPELNDLVLGMTLDEERDATIMRQDINQPIKCKINLVNIVKCSKPIANDEFAKTVGLDSLDELRKVMHISLKVLIPEFLIELTLRQVLLAISNEMNIEVPDVLVQLEMERNQQQVALLGENMARFMLSSSIKRSFIYQHFIEEYSITVTADEITAAIENVTTVYGEYAKFLKFDTNDQETRDHYFDKLIAKKLLDILLPKIQVIPRDITYREMLIWA